MARCCEPCLIKKKNRSNIASAILQDSEQLEAVLKSSEEASGSATEELNKYLDSVEGKLQSLTNRWQEFWSVVIDSDTLKGGIELLTNITEGATKLVDTIGVIPTLVGSISGFASLKGSGIFSVVDSDILDWQQRFQIFGKSIESIKSDRASGTNIFASIFGIDNSQLQKDVDGINQLIDSLDSGSKYADVFKSCMTGVSDSTKTMAEECVASGGSLKDLLSYLKSTTLQAKAASVALKAVSMVGNAMAMALVSMAVSAVVEYFNDLAHAAENAKDTMDDAFSDYEFTKSEIESVNSELSETVSKIDELNAKENLSFTDKDELSNLQETNRELQNRLELLEKEEEIKRREAAESAVASVNASFGSTNNAVTDEGINRGVENDYNAIGDIITDAISATTYRAQTAIDDSNIQNEIVAYKQLNELLDEAYADGRNEDAQKIQESIEDLDSALVEQLSTLQSQKDAMQDYYDIISQKSPEELSGSDDDIIEQYNRVVSDMDYIRRLISPNAYIDETISGILEKSNFDGIKDKLVELGEDGKLSVELLSSKFPELIAYLESAGIDAQQLYGYIMALSNPDAINYSEARNQFLKDIDAYSDNGYLNANQQFNYDTAASKGLLSDESLNAYLNIKAKYTDGQLEYWTVEDWAYHIKNELNNSLNVTLGISSTVDTLNTNLKPAMDAIESAWQEIFTDDGFKLDEIDLIEVAKSVKSELDALAESNEDFDYTAYENFVRVLENSDSTADDVKQSFNELAQSIIDSGVNGAEDYDTLVEALEDLGVVNNDIIAFQSLAENTDALRESGLDLADASYAEIEAFANTKLSAEDASNGITMLLYQQLLVSNNPLNLLASINALSSLGGKAAETASILAELAQIMARISSVQSQLASRKNIGHDTSLLEVTLTGLQNRANLLKQKATSSIEVEPQVTFKNGSGTGKKATDEYLDAFDEEYEKLNDLLDDGIISEKEYCDRLRVKFAPCHSNVAM